VKTDTIEFYEEPSKRPFLIIDSSFQPADGDLVNIEGKTWLVLGRSFTVDYAGKETQSVRCNVIVRARD
jgi:hypothetical protein